MPRFSDFDDATRSSFRAAILCVLGSVFGVALAWFVSNFNAQGYIPIGPFFLVVFGLLFATAVLRARTPGYDPNATFITFVLTVLGAHWVIRFFFVEPGLGPFADCIWTTPNAIANAIFGMIVFGLIGVILGLTYYVARRTYAAFTWRRLFFGVLGIGFPLVMAAVCEYLLVNPTI